MHAYYGCPGSFSLSPQGVHRHRSTTTFRSPSHPVPLLSKPHRRHRNEGSVVVCRASPSSSIDEFDLYDLLGIDSSSDLLQIKNAYRMLQKKCHPDIAGAAGHDMAIVLNEVYSVLSDPISRSAYDKEQAKMSEFRGYTGKPLYSAWLGSESEHRAVFVDEVRCVGCLKCALSASKTFAIESVYGRARVVAQWADPEHQILDAIRTCPVDCISFVERSDLAALEFLMSKQPRGSVRMTTGNAGGLRIPNVFAEIEKFQRKFQEMNEKSSKKGPQERNSEINPRVSAVQGIRSMSSWLYWRSPAATARPNSGEAQRSLVLLASGRRDPKARGPNTEKLREAAAKMRANGSAGAARQKPRNGRSSGDDEYWTPALVLPPPPKSISRSRVASPVAVRPDIWDSERNRDGELDAVHAGVTEEDPMSMRIPVAIGVVSAMVVGYRGDNLGVSLEEHVGGRMALEVVNSFGMQVVLAGITWYLCGAAAVGLIKVVASRTGFRR